MNASYLSSTADYSIGRENRIKLMQMHYESLQTKTPHIIKAKYVTGLQITKNQKDYPLVGFELFTNERIFFENRHYPILTRAIIPYNEHLTFLGGWVNGTTYGIIESNRKHPENLILRDSISDEYFKNLECVTAIQGEHIFSRLKESYFEAYLRRDKIDENISISKYLKLDKVKSEF